MKNSIIFSAILLTGILISGCDMFNGSIHTGTKTDHFNGEVFFNKGKGSPKGFGDLLKWQFSRDDKPWKKITSIPKGDTPPERAGMGELRVTFINHSTVLLQFDSINILTDPVWSNRVSPVSFAGPIRYMPPGLILEQLPHIDMILLSHNHYDHMDIATLQLLEAKYNPLILVPLGNKDFLNEQGMKNVIEMDWWNIHNVFDTEFHLVPASHFSGRGLSDRNKSLWGGFVFKSKGGYIYFAGDSGMGSHFEEIGKKFGQMRFSMIPIGAYKPEWFMADVHISPKEAVEVHQLVNSKLSMAIHFGTFALADDGQNEPQIELKKELKVKGIESKVFLVPMHGKGFSVRKVD